MGIITIDYLEKIQQKKIAMHLREALKKKIHSDGLLYKSREELYENRWKG